MNGTPTKTYKRTLPSHSKLCRFCDTNLGLTYGKIIPSVPIFNKSSNKEFNFKDVCLNDHLKRIGLILDQNSSLSSSSCRKCSRKVLTTVESFLFIQNAVNKTVERRDEIINIKRCANSPCATRQQERKKTRTQTRKCLDYDVDPSCNDLNESIQNLMNLPVEEDDKSLVKVRLTYL